MKNALLIAAFALVLGGPLALRSGRPGRAPAERTVVIITPHNEATRYEFGRAFAAHYLEKTGRRVKVDWRSPGGASEISRYLASEYRGAFEHYWKSSLHRAWTSAVERSFDEARASPTDPARAAFLASKVSSGIDLSFGGGSFDFAQQAAAGRLVDAGVVAAHPELFHEQAIPQTLGGEPLWDPQGRWIGVCLASFGICYNRDSLRRLHVFEPPAAWADLGRGTFLGELALADPTQSGSVAKAFEMLVQQQMSEARRPADGWVNAMRLLQRMGGNARYFTDAGTKIPFDVEAGDAAVGMCIDFFGRFQSEAVRRADGESRLQYVSPAAGSSVGADPIGLLRGAPNEDVARDFIEFTLSPAGQKLWNFKTGTPGGPEKYALRRLPVLPALYAPKWEPDRSDPGVNPYLQTGTFEYRAEWTGPLFRAIAFIVRAMCIDPHEELREAWAALQSAGSPPKAARVFADVSRVSYPEANGRISQTLRGSALEQTRLARELSDAFRAQYRQAATLARAGR